MSIGAVGGAALGTVIFPGIGTIIGGMIGGIGGGIGGAMGVRALASDIGDAHQYDMVEAKCKPCKKKFNIRKYKGEAITSTCPKCALVPPIQPVHCCFSRY